MFVGDRIYAGYAKPEKCDTTHKMWGGCLVTNLMKLNISEMWLRNTVVSTYL